MLIVLCLLVINIYSQESEDRIYSFKKIGEIKEGFSTEESNYFWRIDDLCCDDENNLDGARYLNLIQKVNSFRPLEEKVKDQVSLVVVA